MNIKLIKNLTIFKHCSFNCLREVAQALEEKFFAPGQSIINIGDHGEEMFIIGNGSVEVSLMQETTRTANVRAQAYCDLFLLKKSDFLRIIKDFPELLSSMKSQRG